MTRSAGDTTDPWMISRQYRESGLSATDAGACLSPDVAMTGKSSKRNIQCVVAKGEPQESDMDLEMHHSSFDILRFKKRRNTNG